MKNKKGNNRLKITFIGAGSLGFTQKLIADILSYPALSDCVLSLMDINVKRLEYSRKVACRIINEGGYKAVVEATTDRRKALKGASYVFITILANGIKGFKSEIEIPMKYGVDQAVGDTTGPGGVFRAQRTIPIMLDIAGDIDRYSAPGAQILNYTNPMHMLSWAIYDAFPRMNYVGLCHNVPNTIETLARIFEIPPEEVSHWVAGINHQAWVLEFRHKGKSFIEDIRRKADTLEFYRDEPVRCEMCRMLGYFATESSIHNSEYTPWFRKNPKTAAQFTPAGISDHAQTLRQYERSARQWEERLQKLASGKIPISLARSHEYGAGIINAMEGGKQFYFCGNVKNTCLITNLPTGCCVEVPCMADHTGIKPLYVGDIPPQLAALNQMNVAVHGLSVLAAKEKDPERILQALALDPLTSAVLTPPQIREMTSEMLNAQKKYLPGYGQLQQKKEMKLANPKVAVANEKTEIFKEFNVISRFYVIGPFANTDENGKSLELSQELPPEKKVDLHAVYEGKAGRKIKWKKITDKDMEDDGFVDLNRLLEVGAGTVGYAYTVLDAIADTMLTLQVGSDDGIAVWLNGNKIYSFETARGAARAQAEIQLCLKDGRNELLLKIDQKEGDWGFYANFAEPLIGVTVKD